jgi:hypothetical protein
MMLDYFRKIRFAFATLDNDFGRKPYHVTMKSTTSGEEYSFVIGARSESMARELAFGRANAFASEPYEVVECYTLR